MLAGFFFLFDTLFCSGRVVLGVIHFGVISHLYRGLLLLIFLKHSSNIQQHRQYEGKGEEHGKTSGKIYFLSFFSLSKKCYSFTLKRVNELCVRYRQNFLFFLGVKSSRDRAEFTGRTFLSYDIALSFSALWVFRGARASPWHSLNHSRKKKKSYVQKIRIKDGIHSEGDLILPIDNERSLAPWIFYG